VPAALPEAAWLAIASVAGACALGMLHVFASACATARRRHDLMIRARIIREAQERELEQQNALL
jgi:hypothetical protein